MLIFEPSRVPLVDRGTIKPFPVFLFSCGCGARNRFPRIFFVGGNVVDREKNKNETLSDLFILSDSKLLESDSTGCSH